MLAKRIYLGWLTSMHRKNFGRNRVLQPSAGYTPANEQEVLDILDRHKGQNIRAVGRLHSWSKAILGDGVQLDLRRLNDVVLEPDGEDFFATIGAGCQVKRILKELNRGGATLHSLGLIDVQTIAGAISTGTHGSGRNSMSHYVEEVRLARYDESTGKAFIDKVSTGDDLLAARCSLGALGIILSVKIRCRAQYNVQEHFTESKTLEGVLNAEKQFPLQQFYFIPWRWTYFTQHRCEGKSKRSFLAKLYRFYWWGIMDYAMHLKILFMMRVLRSRRMIRFSFRRIIPLFVIRKWKVTDRSSSMLVMKHEAFRHIEIELFVQRDQLEESLKFTKEVIEVAGIKDASLSEVNQRRINDLGMQKDLEELQNQYHQHYPICVRRILPDDTLISMASGEDQDWYSVSFISYVKPKHRAGFDLFSKFMARSMSKLFGARPHWGKISPLEASELTALYPKFDTFRAVSKKFDPQGVFQNEWTKAMLDADD